MSVLLTAAEMRAWEAASVAAGATWAGLMEQAGRGVAAQAQALLPSAAAAVLVLVGPGNNGGDALVAADHLAAAGAQVQLYVWKRQPDTDDWPWQRVQTRALPITWASDDADGSTLTAAAASAALIIDGLLGVGVSRPLGPDLRQIVQIANAAAAPILAIDVPSGLNADTGAIWGACIRADLTVATGCRKRGHLLFPGAAYVGRLVVAPIDLPIEMEKTVDTTELNAEMLRTLLPERPADSHKDQFGRVMVVAGSYLYPGAAWLTARAATRSGVGVVTLACPRSIYGGTIAALHEATYLPLPEGEPGALSTDAVKVIQKRLGRYKALAIGPGLGDEESTGEFLSALLGLESPKHKPPVGFLAQTKDAESHHKRRAAFGFLGLTSDAEEADSEESEEAGMPPLVIDADGLNLLAKIEHWTEHLRDYAAVLTPHPGEMARLLGVEHIGEDHVQVAADAAKEWGVVVVLKTAHTVIAAPDGKVAIYNGANPALATAGSGDVLTGLLGGLLAQGLAPFDAAQLAVGVHGLAGKLAREELGERGVVAGDIIDRLPQAWRALQEG